MSSLSIGLSGLLVSQKMIDLTGQNITNSSTPGYHLQVGNLAARMAGSQEGDGVELTGITRVINAALENSVTQNTSAQNQASTQLAGLNQLQTYLAPGAGSLQDALTNFFSTATQLSAQPDDLTQRQVFLSAAGALSDGLNTASANLTQLSGAQVTQAQATVSQVNSLTTQIAQLNQQIHAIVATGGTANELLDQRDTDISQLSALVDVRTVPQKFGEVNVLVGGSPLVLNSTAFAVKADINTQNQLYIHASNSQQPLDISGGRLAGILGLYNTTLPQVQAQFDSFAQALVTQVNQVQASGLGLNGPMTSLSSQNAASAANAPLANANLPSPVSAGNLYVTVTNLATGQRTLNKVSIDPTTQSLADMANAISTIPNMQAVVNAQTGAINLIAKPGYGFDFTGNFSTTPDTQTITGTAAPTFDGAYTGAANDVFNFTVVGSGTVGATPGLSLEVRNGAGTLLTSLNIGQGYSPGSDTASVLGVNVKMAAGTVNAGDTFSLNVAADADTTGLLPALGLNSFFVGTGAADVHVNQDLLDHPENLALSKTGQPGDGTNLTQLVNLQDKLTLNNGTQSFQQNLLGIIGDVGSQTQDAQTRSTALDALGQQLQNQVQSVSGVDSNEELMKLVQYQQAYQASAYFVNIVNQSFASLLQILATTTVG